jgi:hypothetical protein
MRQRNIYAIGFIRGRSTHYLATRETNFRRACKTLRDMLKGNKRYKKGSVSLVSYDNEGKEHTIYPLYYKEVK